jgi:hypothetical protein
MESKRRRQNVGRSFDEMEIFDAKKILLKAN